MLSVIVWIFSSILGLAALGMSVLRMMDMYNHGSIRKLLVIAIGGICYSVFAALIVPAFIHHWAVGILVLEGLLVLVFGLLFGGPAQVEWVIIPLVACLDWVMIRAFVLPLLCN